MLFRSLIKSSRTTKPVSAQPVTPLLTRFITSSSSNSVSRTSTARVRVVEGEIPLSKPPSDPNKLSAQDLTEGTYEKHHKSSSVSITTYPGTHSYVDEPDPADSKYKILGGACHSTVSYEKPQPVKYEGLNVKLTSTNTPSL